MTSWLTPLAHAFAQPFKWWFVVAPWEQALRIRLGKRAVLMGPGIHFRLPFLDRVYRQSMRLRTIRDEGQTMTTADGRVLTISVGVEFEVADLRRLYESLANPEVVLLVRVRSVLAQEITTTHSSELTPASLQRAFEVPRDWGLKSVRVFVVGFAYTRTYRLIQSHCYETTTNLDVNQHDDDAGRGS